MSLSSLPQSNLTSVRMITRSEGAKTVDKSLVSLAQSFSSMFSGRADLSGNILSQQWHNLVLALESGVKLFWITADIADAFGSIRLSKLGEILKECQARLSREKEGEARLVKERTERLSKRLLLHTVMFSSGGRKKFFILRRGVLQGDPLSSLLSDIYYGHLVRRELSHFLSHPPGCVEIFLRGADDFLFVSTEKSR